MFLKDADGQLIGMSEQPYEAEDVLQALLESHPDLLAGGQMTPNAPRRWALVKREQGVPARENSGTRFSVDHLFVDQDAIPTLVEVKRSTDTRIRREVVGQMLDYAANGVRYWPVPALEAAFHGTQHELGLEPETTIRELTQDPQDTIEKFFVRVGDNLRAGRIRMVFVADVIPDELMRITEFLNEQMNPAEVFAVEVKQFKAAKHAGTILVPMVYGRTAAASAKSSGRRDRLDRSVLLERSDPATIEAIRLLGELGSELELRLYESPSGTFLKTGAGRTVANVYLADWNSLDIPLEPLRERGFAKEADSAHARLNALTTKPLTDKVPSLPTPEAVRHWPEIREVIKELAAIYANSTVDSASSDT